MNNINTNKSNNKIKKNSLKYFMKNFTIKNKEGIFRVSLLLLVLIVFVLFDVECLFIKFFNTPCLGCGMTRAWKALLQGELKQAYEYHKAFWTVPIILCYIFKGNMLFKKRLWDIMLLVFIIIIFIINYMYG